MNDSTYKLKIDESNTDSSLVLKNVNNLFEEEREYKSFLMKDDIGKIIRLVSNHLIKAIKEQE